MTTTLRYMTTPIDFIITIGFVLRLLGVEIGAME